MKNIKTFKEFIDEVEKDPQLENRLKENPLQTLKEVAFTGPAYASDKLVYRMVVFGFIAVLVFGVLYFIYQYQRSIEVRSEYLQKIITLMNGIHTNDPLSSAKLSALQLGIVGPDKLNGTTPDGIIAVFTGIIGALAGLFAPSPFSKRSDA